MLSGRIFMFNYAQIISSLISVDGIDFNTIKNLIVETKDLVNGDFSLPCFQFAKVLRQSPMAIAQNIAESFNNKYHPFDKIEAVNGYVNFYVNREKFCEDYFKHCEDNLIISNKKYSGKTLCMEYSSVNLAKYMHVGHLSTTVIGESLARINSALGYNVVRMNYVGDWGTPFGKMISAYKLWGNKEDVNKRGVDAIQDLYIRFAKESETNPELEQLARDTFKSLEQGDKETLEIYKWFIDVTIDETKRLTNLLGVNFDTWRGESYYKDKMQEIVEMLESKNLLQESQGAKIVDLEQHKLGVCLVQKSDGTSIYATRDIAAAIDRYNTYKFDKMIYVTAVQQKLHFQQFFKVLELAGFEWAKNLEHCYYGMISLPEGKIASRKGKQALLKDILNEALKSAKSVIENRGDQLIDIDETSQKVGIGAVAYCPLKNEKIKDTVFDLQSALSFEGETSPYMQYSYARANNILDKIELKSLCGVKPNYSSVADDNTFALIKALSNFEKTVNLAADNSEPSIISKYLIDICKMFNKFYHDNRVAGTEPAVMCARVNLCMQFAKILKFGLNLICIECPTKM